MGKTAVMLVMLLATVIGLLGTAVAREVKQDGSGDFTTIQAAIDAAYYNGDAIVVYPGVYYENIYFDGKDISVTAAVELTAVIDGGRNGPVVQFAGTESPDCNLGGFVITNGFSPTGGGIRGANDQHGYNGDKQYAQARIFDCYIVANTAVLGGGGVSEFAGEFVGCAVVGNGCDSGYGGGFAACEVALSHCQVQYNRGCYGGGFSFAEVSLSQGWGNYNEITNNVANYGGGFYCSVIQSEQILMATEDSNRAEVGNCAYLCTFVN